MSGDASRDSFSHEMRKLSEFLDGESSDEELSDKERLQLAFENAQTNTSSVKEQFEDQPSQAFSQWHRTLGDEYSTMDVDWVESDTDGEVYLMYETICVKSRSLTADNIIKYYLPWPDKQRAYQSLDDQLDCPVYVVWHTEECDRFFVRDIDPDAPLRELHGEGEFKDWLDGFRHNLAGGDGE